MTRDATVRVLPRMFVSSFLALAVSSAFFVACGEDDDASAGPGPGSGGGDASIGDGAQQDSGSLDPDATADGATEPALPPLDISKVEEKKWTWFEIPDTSCRDGSPTGIGLNLNPASKKMVIYLEGGGACFNIATCAQNPAKVPRQSHSGGILDRSKTDNPVADWNQVYVPYCTGDVHSGNNPSADVQSVGTQKFVGYANMGIFLKRLASTFPATEQILLTGVSAGGFGAAANFGQTVRIFPAAKVNLVDDSGPLMREPPLAQCLQEQWTTLWKLDTTVLAECGADCAGQADPLMAATKHWAKVKSGQAQGLISATGDQTIRFFFGFGASSCKSVVPISSGDYAAGLADVKAQHAAYANFGTFFYDGTGHTLLGGDGFYTTTVGQTTVADWVKDIVEANKATHVGP